MASKSSPSNSGTLGGLRQQHEVLAQGLARYREELISNASTLSIEMAEVQQRYIAQLEEELVLLREENLRLKEESLRLMHKLRGEKADGRKTGQNPT